MAITSDDTQFFDLELSGFVFNQDNAELVRERHNKNTERHHDYDARYDFRTFIYDCFYEPELSAVTLLCPPLLNFRKLLSNLQFKIDGEQVVPTTVEDLSRCSVITFDCPNQAPLMLSLSHPNFGGNLAIGRSFLEDFKNTNALFTISQNNRLEWIQDWLTHYVKAHGANAVILSDNNSTDYSMKELGDAVCAVPGIDKAAILRARYPFGPTDENSYGALFLQRATAELCRRRFLGHARAVVSADIDELFHSFSGSSIFDATVASQAGYIRADAKWVYAIPDATGSPLRHRDHKYISANNKPKANRKWCVAPQGPQAGRQWLTHFLGSRKDPVDPDFRMWHFRQVSTGWKHDRSGQPVKGLDTYPELELAMEDCFGQT